MRDVEYFVSITHQGVVTVDDDATPGEIRTAVATIFDDDPTVLDGHLTIARNTELEEN